MSDTRRTKVRLELTAASRQDLLALLGASPSTADSLFRLLLSLRSRDTKLFDNQVKRVRRFMSVGHRRAQHLQALTSLLDRDCKRWKAERQSSPAQQRSNAAWARARYKALGHLSTSALLQARKREIARERDALSQLVSLL